MKMKIDKAEKRDNKRNKQQHGMRVDNRSIFVIQETVIKKSKKNKEN
ncbi:MAG: hypothetical protein UY01_C0005G0002 [Candidatus Nomurabacteria bacterium GW2011_GWB1_47_6]|uniref:Uncharacterized protein n=1 Tax=Candidatus Nomurabacteria bacterium GW2011_GWB1_47_6 TaxID=1618749 RepID=A0A0G1W0A1_9BACT|nr:MAG: hypothetical protein UY01_C0005G0002 [Candidatus Nomurabacteria bacterium GW2011_GWB1_47_6]